MYDYSYNFGNMDPSEFTELMKSAMIMGLLESIPSMLIGLATYIITAVAIYSIAKRRGIHKPWLAWIPIANVWTLGCIADQYRYVTRGELKNRRKILLNTSILTEVLGLVFLVCSVVFVVNVFGVLGEVMMGPGSIPEEQLVQLMGPMSVLLMMMLPAVVVSIIYAVFYYIALYDLYKSCEPGNAALYLVLSIFVGITQPIFLLICRNKDLGMQPVQPAYQPVQPVYQQPTWQPAPPPPTWQPPQQPESPAQPQPAVEPWEQKEE